MATGVTDPVRRMVPRWRPSWISARLGLVDPVQHAPSRGPPSLRGLEANLRAWREHRTSAFAADAVSSAFVLNKLDLGREPAEFILKHRKRLPDGAVKVAAAVLGKGQHEPTSLPEPPEINPEIRFERIRVLKRRLRNGPRNPIMWTDLAREYTILGQKEPATRAMNAAVSLTDSNRFILRSAGRFFLHCDDPERAQRLLRRSPAVKYDPWILAAEIATATVMERSSALLKVGFRMVADRNLSPRHSTELVSALATHEFHDGHDRKAKKLFRQALEQATENTVAQVGWASRRVSGLELEARFLSVPLSYEARAWYHFIAADWRSALEQAQLWFLDEPFASRAAAFGSFVSAVALGDYSVSAGFARLGLACNPSDPLLRTNLVFALASGGDIDEAIKETAVLSGRSLDRGTEVVMLANRGLVAFRMGDEGTGRALYHQAIDLATEIGDRERRAWAMVFLAREEVRVRYADWRDTIVRAEKAIASLSPSSRRLADSMLRELQLIAQVMDGKVFDTAGLSTNR